MIGIITINDRTNIGNRLQNYAVYKFLSSYDKTFNIVRFYNCETKDSLHFFRVYLNPKRFIKAILNPIVYINLKFRNHNFKEFEKNISNAEILKYNTNYNELNKKYDFFVCGSDQIWNPNFPGNGMYINMLGFTKMSKKIALSPSVGCNELTKSQIEEFKKYLNDFSFLNTREKIGSDLIKKYLNKECETLIDPTLFIKKEEWEALAKKPKFHDENKAYLLLYFLGELNKESNDLIKKIAKENDLKIINLLDKKSKYYRSGPSEFIYLIKNASLVLTDSFHGSIFSFIFNRPFRIFERSGDGIKMNSRIFNLIDILNLDENIIINKDSELKNLFITNYDYDKLNLERLKYKNSFENAYNFLLKNK